MFQIPPYGTIVLGEGAGKLVSAVLARDKVEKRGYRRMQGSHK